MTPCILVVVGLSAWCGWASSYHRSTTPALVTWCASLAGVVAVDLLFWRGRHNTRLSVSLSPASTGWPRPGQGGSTRVFLGISPWLALLLIVVVWEVLGIDTGPHVAHLTISALAQAYRPIAAALLLVWMLVGLGYGAARARAPLDPMPGQAGQGGQAGLGASPGVSLSAVPIGIPHRALPPALLLPGNRAVGVAFWVALVVAGVLVDLVARHSRGRVAGAEEFVRLISRPTAANILLVVAWGYAGWHLFAR
jgi:hypothetical protein